MSRTRTVPGLQSLPLPALQLAAVFLIVLDLAFRAVTIQAYLSPGVFTSWDAVLLGGFATFPAILLPALLTIPRRSAASSRLVLAAAFSLAAGELALAADAAAIHAGVAFHGASAGFRADVVTTTLLPVAASVLVTLGWIGLARGLSGIWALEAKRRARLLAGMLMIGPLVLAIGTVPFRFGSTPWLTYFVDLAIFPFGAAWLAWVGLVALPAKPDDVVRRWTAAAGALLFVATLLPGIYLESWILNLSSGGNLRWDVQSLLFLLGMVALDVAIARAVGRPIPRVALVSGLAVLVAALLAGCAAAPGTPSPIAITTAPPFAGPASVPRSTVEAAGYGCAARPTVGGFQHVECPKPGVADIDLYVRDDGTIAGIDAYAPGTGLSTEAMLGILKAPLVAAAGPTEWGDIAAAIEKAGARAVATTTVLPSGLSVLVHGYADGTGLLSVAVLAGDLASVWGRPPVPRASPTA